MLWRNKIVKNETNNVARPFKLQSLVILGVTLLSFNLACETCAGGK
jgi:hypothetical protein